MANRDSDTKHWLGICRESCRLSVVKKKIKECNWHRISVSFWGSFAFIGWGASLVVFGTTLLDLANHVSVGVGTISLMFTCRAVGSSIGIVSVGVAVDKLRRYTYSIISFIIFGYMAATIIIPLSVHIAMLSVVMMINGFMSGGIINSIQVLTFRLWKDKSGPANQVLHFCFALGAFVSPLIAEPFINEKTVDIVNRTCVVNNQSLLIDPDSVDDTDCSQSTNNNESCLLPSDEPSSNFAWAYWICSAILIPPLCAFIFFAIRNELLQKCTKRKISAELESDKQSENIQSNSDKKRRSLVYRIIILGLIFCFLFLYVGTEVAFGNLIFTVAVTGELCFSKSSAALLQSVFWGAFAFMRFFSVSLALLKVRASVMLVGNLSGSLLASIIMTFYPHNKVAIWIGSAVLGMSNASIFPNVMTWMNENIPVTGVSTAVVTTGATVGIISLPALLGVLIVKITPDTLIYALFVGVILSALIVTALFIVGSLNRKRNNVSTQNGVYSRLNQINLDEEESDVIDLEQVSVQSSDV